MPPRNLIFGLLAIWVAFLALNYSRSSPAWFGYYHDDSLYWSSAKALAQGEGYRMPSVPGEPPQTKYPVFYPWLLSWVWRLQPDFPGNLQWAWALSALSGVGFLTAGFALVRQLGAGPKESVALTALCALHPVLLHVSGLLLSDVPFMALALGAVVMAQAALTRRQEGRGGFAGFWAGAIALAVLALWTRSIGIAVIAGVVVAAVLRRAYRAAALFGALCSLPVVAALWRAGQTPGRLSGAAVAASGLDQTLLFYTSYLGFWRLSVPDWPTFSAMFSRNLVELLKTPAVECFFLPAGGFASPLLQISAVALSFGIVSGVVGRARRRGWHPVHFVLVFYSGVVLLWNYTLMDRFMLLFLPLFAAGVWHEARRIAARAVQLFREAAPWGERAAAALLVCLLAGLTAQAAWRAGWTIPQAYASALEKRQALNAEKRRAYAWIEQHAAPSDRFIADEDASLYLHTGRQGLRPMAFSTAAFYRQDQRLLDQDLARMSDTARGLRARYWLVASDDYHLESAEEWIRARTEQLLEPLVPAYSGPDGEIKIYDISSLSETAKSRGKNVDN